LILVDSNVLIDFLSEGEWTQWSRQMVSQAQARDQLAVNLVVRAETAGRFTSMTEQTDFLTDLAIKTLPMNDHSAFRAGQAHRLYRRRGGDREAILADFLIGGHAVELGAVLLTRDRHRFGTYFPELTLITPETDNG
jgi:hypothetical protein